MSKFFDDTMQGLLEAVAINDGKMKLTEKKNMAAPTFTASKITKTSLTNMQVTAKSN